MSLNAGPHGTAPQAPLVVRQARRAVRLRGRGWFSMAMVLFILLSLVPAPALASGSLAQASSVRVLGITAGVGMPQGEIEGAATIAVSFSEPMNARSTQPAFSIKPTVPGTLTWKKTTLLFTPQRALDPSTAYTVTVGKGARSTRGPSLAAPFSYSFTTAPPPSILRTLPSAGASDVPTDTMLTLSFDRLMVPLASLTKQPDAARWVTISPAVRGRWLWLGTATAGFRPEHGFLPGTEYKVDVKPGWPSAAGVPIQSGLSFRFSTLAPGIASISPVDGEDSLDLDGTVVVRFNQPVDAASAQNAFSLVSLGDGRQASGTYGWSQDSSVMTFTASSLLSFDTAYRAVISGPVRPLGGASTPLKGISQSWQFSTVDETRVLYHRPEGTISGEYDNDFSFTLNNPLREGQDLASFLSITPSPEEFGELQVSSAGVRVYADKLRLVPNTTYTFELKPGLLDKWGFPVQGSIWQVRTDPLSSGIAIAGGSFQPIHAEGPTQLGMRVTNLSRLHLRLYSLTEQEVVRSIDGHITFNSLLREWDIDVPPGNLVTTIYPVISADPGLDRLSPGYYFLRVTGTTPNAGTVQYSVVLMIGRTGLVAKTDGTDLLVWATDLLTGRSIPDYPVRVEQRISAIHPGVPVEQQGRTGPDGVLRLRLQMDQAPLVTVWSEAPGDAAVASTRWSYSVPSSGVSERVSASGQWYGDGKEQAAIYTDRPIYRPGQIVYFSGIHRQDDDANYALSPAGTPVYLYANDDRDESIYTTTLSLSPTGTFNGQFALPETAATGDYHIRVGTLAHQYHNLATVDFKVEEYRKPDFEVDVTTRGDMTRGGPITATLKTSYYFGGPLAHLTATVQVWDEPYTLHWIDPKTGEQYRFGEDERGKRNHHSTTEEYGRGTADYTFERSTNSEGVLVLDLSDEVRESEGSRNLLVEGMVQDLSNQLVAKRASLVVHQGLYYVGLSTDTHVAEAGTPFTYTLRTVAPDAKAASGGRAVPGVPLSVRVLWQEWVNSELRETEVATGNVVTDGEGRARYSFTPGTAGTFRLVVEGVDSLGNKIRSGITRWASGDSHASVPWRYRDVRQVDMIADKTQYRVGETARILVTSPFTEAIALLTVERGHIRRHRIVELRGAAPIVEVQLQEGDLPNVHIGLTLLGRGQVPESAPHDLRRNVQLWDGSVNLSVSTESKRLRVSIEPQDQTGLKPGGTTNVLVRTTTSDGKPTPAELSLAVVDEAIFALGGDNTADIFDRFWHERETKVETSSNYKSRNNLGRDGYALPAVPVLPATGGGGTELPGMPSIGGDVRPAYIRSEFRDTALWRTAVTTGPDGTALVAVRWPDNLTTWRLTARGVTGNTSLGSTDREVTVTQPVLLRPVTPRFLVIGDNPRMQAVVHNNTTATLQLEASLVVSGALNLDAKAAPSRRLILSPGTQATVSWDTKVGSGDTGRMRYWVRTIGMKGSPYMEDAVALQLPVKAFSAPEIVSKSGEVAGTRAEESLYLPYSESPLAGELVIQVAPSLAAATAEGVKYLVEFEHACTEQTTSRYLPLVVLEHAYRGQGQKTPYSDKLPDIMQRAFKRLDELQHNDGGWGWWAHDETRWWQTAYVVHGLLGASASGQEVPEDLLRPGLARLRAFLLSAGSHGLDETSLTNVRAYTLYLLVQVEDEASRQALIGQASNLYGQAATLSVHARSWLAIALSKLGLAEESNSLLDSVVALARQDESHAYWTEANRDYAGMGSDSRATAIALDALITLRPEDPLVAKVVRWLMSNQRDGHWQSTQDTAFILIAIAHYLEQSKELSAKYNWQARAFGTNLGGGVVGATNLAQTQTLRVPVSSLPQNSRGTLDLTRSAASGKMYYRMSLRYFAPGEAIQARSEGFSVTRNYYSVGGDEPVRAVRAGELVKVRLTIAVPNSAHYVIVSDPLPAGLEAVNGSLNTTSYSERPPAAQGTVLDEGYSTSGASYYRYRRWGPFSNVEMRDDRTVLYATYMSPGTYVYEYFARATTAGIFMALPTHAEQMYQPEVFGHSDGGVFTVK